MAAPADAGVRTAPNNFALSGCGVHVTYASSGIDGQPSLTYQDAIRMLSFRGAELRVVDSDLATTVSVTIQQTVDSGSTSFTVLIPGVELPGGQPIPVATVGVSTLHRFSILPITGQLDSYYTVALHGTASLVEF